MGGSPWLSCCSSCFPRRSRRGCNARGGRFAAARRRGAEGAGARVGEARAFATPRRLALVIEGVPAKSPGSQRRAQGPARQRAEAGDRRLRQVGRAQVDRGSPDRQGREEGRLLRRPDRQAGPRRQGDRRPRWCRPWRRISLAEVDALGLGQNHLGAAAALDRLPARRQGGAVRDRRRSRAASTRAGIASTATSRSR